MENLNKLGGVDTKGIDTSGLNAETFGTTSVLGEHQENDMDSYAASWSNEGAYSVPGYQSVEPEPMANEGRGLEIATLVFGILALVVCCCNGLFAVIGLILGVVAIAKGKKSGMTIAGIVCSAMGLLLGVIALLFIFSDYGQEITDAFMEGYEQGYESSSEVYDGGSAGEESEEYMENSVESHEGTSYISDDVAGRVVIDGTEIFIPCKLSELMKLYEISEYSQEDMNGGLGSYESKSIYFSENGEENGIFVDVQNYTEEELTDIKNAQIGMISFDGDSGKQVEVIGGLALGMSETEMEEVLKDYEYNKSKMSGFVFYNVFAGEDSDYSVSVMMSEGVAINITLFYSGL